MWPGVFSLATFKCPGASTAMFAFLSLAGDLGCAAGPSAVGFISDVTSSPLKTGFLVATAFPVLLFVGVLLCNRLTKKRDK